MARTKVKAQKAGKSAAGGASFHARRLRNLRNLSADIEMEESADSSENSINEQAEHDKNTRLKQQRQQEGNGSVEEPSIEDIYEVEEEGEEEDAGNAKELLAGSAATNTRLKPKAKTTSISSGRRHKDVRNIEALSRQKSIPRKSQALGNANEETKNEDENEDEDEDEDEDEEANETAKESGIISKSLLNDLKLKSINKRVLTKTAQKQWEELPPDSVDEIVKLLLAYIEPSLEFFKSNKNKKQGRKTLIDLISTLRDEISETLVPIGFKKLNFSLDYLISRASYLQKTYSRNLQQVESLERTLINEEKAYNSNLEYLEKLERNFKAEARNFEKLEKKLVKPLKTGGVSSINNSSCNSSRATTAVDIINDNSLNYNAWSFANESLPDSFDKVNLAKGASSLSSATAFSNSADVGDDDIDYDPSLDADLTSILQVLNGNLSKLQKNVEIIKQLDIMVDRASAILE